MLIFNPKALAAVTFACLILGATLVHADPSSDLSIRNPWARETAVGQTVGGGFMTIANNGAREDRLLSGTSPAAAEVQLHSMTMDGGVMRMRQVTDGIAIPAHGTVELKPGGYHVMFIGLKHPLRRGDTVPVTLRFQRAGTIRMQFAVQPVGSSGPMGGDHAGH